MKICNCWILMSAKVYFSTGFLFPYFEYFSVCEKENLVQTKIINFVSDVQIIPKIDHIDVDVADNHENLQTLNFDENLFTADFPLFLQQK